MDKHDVSAGKRRSLEHLILLVLGANNKKISQLHLQKEVFLLWNFHPSIKDFVFFIEHYKGPYSPDIREAIINPIHLENCWNYDYKSYRDNLSGGYICLTSHGEMQYQRLVETIKEKKEVPLLHLLNGIEMIRKIYGELSMEELLLLVYVAYPSYTKNSELKKRIEENKDIMAKRLIDKNLIDSIKYNEILKERLQ